MKPEISVDSKLFAAIYKRVSRQEMTEAELALVEDWLAASPENQTVFNNLQSSKWMASTLKSWERENPEAIWEKSFSPEQETPVRRISFFRSWWAAAAILLFISAGMYFWLGGDKPDSNGYVYQPVDIQPGTEGAILTLADGSQVVLDTIGNGVIADQNGAKAVVKDGELVYDATGESSDVVVYNTMSTPKGRQYSLMLSDGTKVWMNAASSLRYPTTFTGNERRVEVTGEVYFEVARNKSKPFRVLVQDREEIEVLGTSFNVNAYTNEAFINTTLLDGSIRVSATHSSDPAGSTTSVLLKPGQQAQLSISSSSNQKSDIKIENNPDIEQVMAWKNGQFNFEGMSLQQVMKQLERWYDITVRYEPGIEEVYFGGSVSRQISLQQLLKELEFMGIHFRMEGQRQLVVLP